MHGAIFCHRAVLHGSLQLCSVAPHACCMLTPARPSLVEPMIVFFCHGRSKALGNWVVCSFGCWAFGFISEELYMRTDRAPMGSIESYEGARKADMIPNRRLDNALCVTHSCSGMRGSRIEAGRGLEILN